MRRVVELSFEFERSDALARLPLKKGKPTALTHVCFAHAGVCFRLVAFAVASIM